MNLFEAYWESRITGRARTIVVIAAVALLALAVRLPGMGEAMTADENSWMTRGALFWNELASGDPGGTYITTHPGATVLWLIGSGIKLQEARLGVAAAEGNLMHFRKAAVFPVVLVTSIMIGVITWLLTKLFHAQSAVFAGILLACEPYLAGMSKVAHLDMLQALLMLAAFLSFMFFLRSGSWSWVAAAGAFFGLSLGGKMFLAFWLPLFFTIMIVFVSEEPMRLRARMIARVLGVLTGTGALVFFAVWPALWVKDDLARPVARDAEYVLLDEHVRLSQAEDPVAPATFYMRTVVGRMAPYTLLLTLGAALVLFLLKKKRLPVQREAAWLLFYAVGYLAVITLAAKKADRYALPALVALPAVAGWLAAASLPVMERKLMIRPWRVPVYGALLMALVAVPVLWGEYASAYMSPIGKAVLPLSQQGWGEGLEEAAKWMNEQPGAKDVMVASWYPNVFREYFAGRTVPLSVRDKEGVRYIVLYRNMGGRAPDTLASQVLDEYVDQDPVRVVKINGVEYVWIYEKEENSKSQIPMTK